VGFVTIERGGLSSLAFPFCRLDPRHVRACIRLALNASYCEIRLVKFGLSGAPVLLLFHVSCRVLSYCVFTERSATSDLARVKLCEQASHEGIFGNYFPRIVLTIFRCGAAKVFALKQNGNDIRYIYIFSPLRGPQSVRIPVCSVRMIDRKILMTLTRR